MVVKDLEKRMMKREYFPAEINYPSGLSNLICCIPPVHPLIVENGIPINDYAAICSIVIDALKNTASEYNHLSKHSQSELGMMFKKVSGFESGDFSYVANNNNVSHPNMDAWPCIQFMEFPIGGELVIEKTKISPSGEDLYVRFIDEGLCDQYVLPGKIKLPPELLEEYGMEIESKNDVMQSVVCPSRFITHNLSTIQEFFYGNLIIELDNHIVRQKYSL